MTDADHAAVLRRRIREYDHPYDEQAAIERSIELLEREVRMDGTVELDALKRRDAVDDGIVT